MNTATLKGNWNIAKGKLMQKYAELTDRDLIYITGMEEELFGRIQKRTGRARAEIEKFIRDSGCEFPSPAHVLTEEDPLLPG